jgi:hypothetical protein
MMMRNNRIEDLAPMIRNKKPEFPVANSAEAFHSGADHQSVSAPRM